MRLVRRIRLLLLGIMWLTLTAPTSYVSQACLGPIGELQPFPTIIFVHVFKTGGAPNVLVIHFLNIILLCHLPLDF